MFFREKIDKFLSYRFNDYKINIIFEKKFNFNFIYEMSQNKFKIFKKYLNDNFIKEFIRSSHSPVVSFVFFIRKFNEGLHFCVNHRALNAIIIKNRYLLFLILKNFIADL